VGARTHFIGEVPWDHVPSYLAASDVFVYPSPWEGSPNAVIEAMAAGVPVVVSDIAAHREIIEHGRTGFLASDPESMARCVDTLGPRESRRSGAPGSCGRDRERCFAHSNKLGERGQRRSRWRPPSTVGFGAGSGPTSANCCEAWALGTR